ncbi:MAG TPA: DUF885 domain-containing protein [Mycobacteriales bacterium]|nr:DUF885 domain-containing protein [Mycobacteriales bacterium]
MSEIDGLADEYLDLRSRTAPLWATFLGVSGYDDLLPDASAAGEAAAAERLRDIASRAEALSTDQLSPTDRVSRAVLVQEAIGQAEQLEDAHTELSIFGPFAPLSQVFLGISLTPASGTADVLARLRSLPTYLGQVGERFRAGAERGRGPHATGLRLTVDQVSSYLALDLDSDPLFQPASGTPYADETREALRDEVRSAMQGLLDVLSGPVAAKVRDDERPGLAHIPDGDAIYRRALAFHTTTTRTPEEVHQAGLDLCAELREEYARLGESVFGSKDVVDVLHRLRNDLGLRYTNKEEMVAEARAAIVRVEEVLPQWFGTFHRAPCEVQEMGELEAPGGVLGRYLPPATDGSRPGYHLINTHKPHTRTRYEYETLAYHESVPGHHLQLTVSQELGAETPGFRRYGYIAAFSEGWGLYTERLCEEMGLYSADLTRFGMVSFDSWRACRLVVDTGMHHLGWSRQRAIDFMWENSALTMENIVNEVDRYIAWPGQACAYMAGRFEISELRTRAQQKLGSSFDIRAFHDAVLLNGSIPLPVLRDEVERKLSLSSG